MSFGGLLAVATGVVAQALQRDREFGDVVFGILNILPNQGYFLGELIITDLFSVQPWPLILVGMVVLVVARARMLLCCRYFASVIGDGGRGEGQATLGNVGLIVRTILSLFLTLVILLLVPGAALFVSVVDHIVDFPIADRDLVWAISAMLSVPVFACHAALCGRNARQQLARCAAGVFLVGVCWAVLANGMIVLLIAGLGLRPTLLLAGFAALAPLVSFAGFRFWVGFMYRPVRL